MRILIIRFSSIGDILLTTPFIRQVRNKFPDARIDYVIKDKFSELIKYNPHISQIIELTESSENSLKDLTNKIKPNHYQYVFDLHNNIRSILLRLRVRAAYKSHIKKDKIQQKILLWSKRRWQADVKQIPERYHAVGKAAGIKDDGQGLEIFWPDSVDKKVREKINVSGLDLSHPAIGLAPGAGFYTKRWPLEYFSELIYRLEDKFEIVLFGGKEEAGLAIELEKKHKVYNFTGTLSILESGAAISVMKLLISNDSGMMHMATAVKTPVLAIFGSSVKELGFFPYRSKSIVVENNHVACRPCSHIGRNTCPRKHFKCMMDITPDIVYGSALELLRL